MVVLSFLCCVDKGSHKKAPEFRGRQISFYHLMGGMAATPCKKHVWDGEVLPWPAWKMLLCSHSSSQPSQMQKCMDMDLSSRILVLEV